MTSKKPGAGPQINGIYFEAAPRLYGQGYSPVPLSDKEARVSDWPAIFCDARPTLEDVVNKWSRVWRGNLKLNGIGVGCYGGLVVVDFDGPEADADFERAYHLVAGLRHAPACRGRRGRKVFLRSEDGLNRREWGISSGATGGALELLTWHRVAVIPPTVHPTTGQPYVWLDPKRTLFNTALADLPTISAAEVAALRASFVVDKEMAITSAVARVKETKRERRAAEIAAIQWNRDPRELARYADALRWIDPESETNWLMVRDALFHYGGLHCVETLQLFDTWSGGGVFMGIAFPGSLKCNKTKTQAEAWAEGAIRPPKSMGAIVDAAQKVVRPDGTHWDSRRSVFGLGALGNALIDHRRSNSDVARAAQLVPTGQLFDEAMKAHYLHASRHGVVGNALAALRWLNLGYANHNHGMAWPSLGRIGWNADLINENGRDTEARNRPTSKAFSALSIAGYVKRDPNHPTPDASRGPTRGVIVPTPPPGHTWVSLIAWFRIEIGHDPATATPTEEELYPTKRAASGTIIRQETTPSTPPHNGWVATGGSPPPPRLPAGGDTPGETERPTHQQVGHHTSLIRHQGGVVGQNQEGSFNADPQLEPIQDPLTIESLIASTILVPELTLAKMHEARRQGVGSRNLQRLVDLLKQATGQGVTIGAIQHVLDDAERRIAFGMSKQQLTIEAITPGEYLARLHEKLAELLLTEHSVDSEAGRAVVKRRSARKPANNDNGRALGAAYRQAKDGEFEVPFPDLPEPPSRKFN